MWYGPSLIEQKSDCASGDIAELRGRAPVLWVDVAGLADVSLLQEIGDIFGLHSLALEDVVNVHQRPKSEEFADHAFLVARMLVPGRGFETEQVSMFLGDNFILTFQERPGDCFETVRDRIRRGRGRIRNESVDYLAYALIDAVIDGYFPPLEALGDEVDALEEDVVDGPKPHQVDAMHRVKRDLLALRRAIWPTREMVNALIRDEAPHFRKTAKLYLRDCYDHTIQLMDIIETYREILSGLLDVYLSSQSAHMNEVMKVLTIIATIFIPLSFVAGVYGMNFDRSASPWNMPELGWLYGYPFSLLLMIGIAVGLLIFFWRRGWLGGNN